MQSELAKLESAGVVSGSLVGFSFPVRTDATGKPVQQAPDEVVVTTAKNPAVILTLPSLTPLFRGTRVPPSFQPEPPDEYVEMFAFVEGAIARWCDLTRHIVNDTDMEKIFTDLARRPDGKMASLLGNHLRGVLKVLALVRPLSAAECEAILRRCGASVRRFRTHPTSHNYFEYALKPLLG